MSNARPSNQCCRLTYVLSLVTCHHNTTVLAKLCLHAESACPQYDGYTFTPYKDLPGYDIGDALPPFGSNASIPSATYDGLTACLTKPECKAFSVYMERQQATPSLTLKYWAPRPDQLTPMPDTFNRYPCSGLYTRSTGLLFLHNT